MNGPVRADAALEGRDGSIELTRVPTPVQFVTEWESIA